MHTYLSAIDGIRLASDTVADGTTDHSSLKHGGAVSVVAPHTVVDRIKDHKLVIVAGNQADRLRRQITKLGYFVKAGSGYNSTGRDIATSSPHTGSHRTQHPACSRR
jgi:hypothetical protein